MQMVEATFSATTGHQVIDMDSAEEVVKEWIQETYPEFYDVVIEEVKEVNQ